MPSTGSDKFVQVLKDIFMFDQADLDFGIYRIMNAKRDEISRFLEHDLVPQVKATLGTLEQGDRAGIEAELNKAIRSLEDLGVDPDSSKKVQELRAQYSATTDVGAIENEVFSDLANFFRRYYRDGDFLSLRRYKKDVYALPYEGEEVKLHWANADQYYIKSSEYFRDYTFKLPDDRRVHFKLIDADTEQNNNKPAAGQERRFVLVDEHPLAEQDGELVIRFAYKQDGEKNTREKLNAAAAARILGTPGYDLWTTALATKAPTEKNANRTLLDKHLNDYTARYTFDYFIHKDLGGFLRRELDFFIKNEVMHLDDIEEQGAQRVEQYLGKIKAIRRIAHKIIDLLAQLEDFQKKLWLKKKFVVETNYCVTLDCVPPELYGDVAANDAQREEWVRLFAIDEIKHDITRDGYSVPLSETFLHENRFLVLDTKFFDQQFKDELLASFDDLDAQTDGLLIHSENFQALNLIRSKYTGKVDGIYIDPPYNTNATEIAYKNGYKDSSWLSLMNDRLSVCSSCLTDEGIACVTIDDYEVHNLAMLMSEIFNNYEITPTIIEYNHRGRVRSNFATTHEYGLWALKEGRDLVTKLKDVSQDIRRNLRRTGTSSRRIDSPSQFFGIEVDNNTLEIRSVTTALDVNVPIPEHANPDTTMVWPIDSDRIERRWYYGRERVIQEAQIGTVWAKRIDGEIQIHYHQEGQEKRRKSVWTGSELDASTFGSELLNELFGQRDFPFPKSIYAVQRCLEAMSWANESLFMDFFAGSGTTAHAVININREQGGARKYILVEMGEYFEMVTKPRIQKVIYSKDWKGGKPVSREGSSHLFKYLRLESFEDALNNLVWNRTETQQSLLQEHAALREDYLLRYMLDVETRGSASLLNIQQFAEPFAYELDVAVGGVGETRRVAIDLVETFNYLLGLRVKQMDTIRGIKTVQGVSPAGDKVLIIWRSLSQTSNEALDEFFRKQGYNTQDREFDLIYVNGDNNLENLRRADEMWKVRLIEEEFQRLMFDVRDV